MTRGMQFVSMQRLARELACEAMTAGTSGPKRRLIASTALALLVLVGIVVAPRVAREIGPHPSRVPAWLAGVLDSAGVWWNGLSPLQQVGVGAGGALLVVLSGGSLGLAFGLSGAATYGLEHARGGATFVRDPGSATSDYLASTTPAAALLDVGEFALTFAPGNFAGAGAGRAIRLAAEEYARDPTLFLDARRAALAGDRGSFVPLSGRLDEDWPAVPEAGTPEHSLGFDPAIKRFRQSEYQTAIRIIQERGVALVRAPPSSPVDWMDSSGATYDAVGGFPSEFFDAQWENLKLSIVQHLDKADLVPVDVSSFSRSQTEQVTAFIAQFPGRVFVVGG